MSAFVHENDHIDLLVALAIRVGATITHKGEDGREVTFGLTTNRWDPCEVTLTPTELGKVLLAENVASVRHAYPQIDQTDEGAGYDRQVAEYTYTPVVVNDETFDGIAWATAGTKAVHSYRYQSCENDNWTTTAAFAWCEVLLQRMAGPLPGYDEANTWTFDRSDRKRVLSRFLRMTA